MTRAQAEQRYERLSDQQDELARDAEDLETDIDSLESEISDWLENKQEIERQIARNRADIKKLKAHVAKLDARHGSLEKEKAELVQTFNL